MDTTNVTGRIKKNALISAVVMPGLGQIYNGELFKGICFFTIFIVLPLSLLRISLSLPEIFLLPGVAVSLLSWLFFYALGIIDAFRTASKNEGYVLKTYNRWYFYLPVWCIGAFWLGSVTKYAQKNIMLFGHIETGSMEPAVTNGDYVIFDNSAGDKISPERGNIILFRYPDDRSKLYVKRIAGLPGDTLSIDDSTVFVPHGHVFVLGDNEKNAIDSRTFGPVPLCDVVGKARIVYFSLGQNGIRWKHIGKRL